MVKACQMRIGEGETCVVETLDRAGNEKILTDGFNREVVFEPGLRMAQVELEKAKTGEKRSDWQRLLDTLAETDGEVEPGQMEVDLKLAGELYGMRRASGCWNAGDPGLPGKWAEILLRRLYYFLHQLLYSGIKEQLHFYC